MDDKVARFQNFEALRSTSSAETYKCVSRIEGNYALSRIAAKSIVFTKGWTKHQPEDVRISGEGYELRRRNNGQDELVAYRFSTESFQYMKFLEGSLKRE